VDKDLFVVLCHHIRLSVVRRVVGGRLSQRAHVLLARNWPEIFFKYNLERGDVVKFKNRAFGLKMNIYKRNSSIAKTYIFPDHS
jgi:hypothetical protein